MLLINIGSERRERICGLFAFLALLLGSFVCSCDLILELANRLCDLGDLGDNALNALTKLGKVYLMLLPSFGKPFNPIGEL